MGKVETVLINTKNGPVRINKSEFDAKKHKLSGAAEPAPASVTPSPANPPVTNNSDNTGSADNGSGTGDNSGDNGGKTDEVIQYGVTKIGKKHIVVNAANGQPITGIEGIDTEGYGSNADAWKAVTAATAPKSGDNSGS